MSKSKSMAGTKWLFIMAWRDGKASGNRLFLFIASIILGITAVVSIQSFSENLQENIQLQSKALMGADYIIDGNQLPNEKVQGIIDSLGGADAQEVTFASMAAFPKNGSSRLVQVRGIDDGGFPFYGKLETAPISAADNYQNYGGALVDATLMLQFGLETNDSIKIGQITLPIIGALKSAPGSSVFSTTMAPPVILPYKLIEASGLIQIGSRTDYEFYFKRPEADLEELDKTLDPILDAENSDLDTHTSTSQRMGRRYDNFGKFLNLVAFIALLLGCVGIASSVHIYIKEKLRALAVLKCLGATRKQTFLIYLIQIAAMGLIGGVIGTLAGVGLQQLFPLFLQDLLPFDVQISISIPSILTGLLLGLFMSVLFALLPLMNTWYVSPLQVLRINDDGPTKSRKAIAFVFSGIFLFILLFSYWLLRNWMMSFSFVLGILLTFSILAGFAWLFMKAIKTYFPSSWGFMARQSLLNLFRPNNQTMVLILAIGIGAFLISTLYFTKDLLLARTSLEEQSGNPNIILLDVQTEQTEIVAQTIIDNQLPLIDHIPIITMRVASLEGIPVSEIRKDTSSQVNSWILNHEFRVTYRDSLIPSETLTSGEWVPEYIPDGGSIPISISDNVAENAKLEVGDSLSFNVQGVIMETFVANIRTVDWGRAQLNFSLVFPVGVLENAPQFHVLTTKAIDEASSANLQRTLVNQFPNISVIDIRQVMSIIQSILDKITWVINFMAFFSILTGIIVLIGSVRNSKYQRIKESVLLRTIGARSQQILKLTALEYLYLGVLGSGIGIFLSLISSQLLAWFVFDTAFSPSWVPFLVLLPGISLLVLLIGLGNSRSVLNSPPLEVLRKEAR